MLKNSSANAYAIGEVVTQMQRSGFLLQAASGTPVHGLVESSFATPETDVGNDVIASMVANAACQTRATPIPLPREEASDEDSNEQYYVSTHTLNYYSQVRKLGDMIKRNMLLVRTATGIIKPAFEEISSTYLINGSPVPIEITCIDTCLLATRGITELFASAAGRNTGNPRDYYYKVLNSYPCFENLDAFPVKDLLSTGSSVIDPVVAEWAVLGGAKVMFDVYHGIYAMNVAPTKEVTSHRITGLAESVYIDGASQLSADVYLALYLISKNIDKLNLSILGGISYDNLKRHFAANAISAAIQGQALLTQLMGARKSGKLVVRYPNRVNVVQDWRENAACYEIQVDSELYEKFIDGGGSADVLIGSYFSDRVSNIDQLLANADQLTKEAAKGISAVKRQRHQYEMALLMGAIRRRLYSDLNALDEDHARAVDRGCIEEELTRLNKHLTEEKISQLYTSIRELYCSIIYKGTEVQALLRAIDEVDPATLDGDQNVIQVAITEYMTRWMLSQCYVALP